MANKTATAGKAVKSKRDEREANRIHCRVTRERKREKERQLREEVDVLLFYKAIVEDGPDLFSLHRVEADAPFSFLCENFYVRLQLVPQDILGRPLAAIVDPRDNDALQGALFRAMGWARTGVSPGPGGTLVNLRLACGGIACHASMTIIVGSQGLIVVTRVYDS